MRNERYAVEFINKKGQMDFSCGLVSIEDILIIKDPCRKAVIYDLENGNYREPVAIFEKLARKREWIRTL